MGQRPQKRDASGDALTAFEEAGGDLRDPAVARLVGTLGAHARSLLPLVLRDPSLPGDVLARPLHRDAELSAMRARFLDAVAGLGDSATLRRVLRRLRHRAIVRVALREVEGLADIDQTCREVSFLASAAVEAALRECARSVMGESGTPRDAEGQAIPLVVLGMGKLGGMELNLGSDIDLCFFYEHDGTAIAGDSAAESRTTTAHEVFSKVVARTAKVLSEVTEDGFVFRVDLRLRPEGSQGPLACSLASAERYYATFGRTWERGALVRATPVAGDLAFGARLLATLRPFVFERAVKPAIATEMAGMLRRTRQELSVDEARDIKLGHGGIREAEFFVQSLQLIWGGQHPELQVAGTVDAIRRLVAAGVIGDKDASSLESAWALLRRVEHRIHVQAGYQTHELPPDREGRRDLARSLGFNSDEALTRDLDDARQRVSLLFASLLEESQEQLPLLDDLCDRVAAGATASEIAAMLPEAMPDLDPDEGAAHLLRLARRPNAPLSPHCRKRYPRLGPSLLAEVRQATAPEQAVHHLANMFARLGGSWGYERMLADEPRLGRRLVGLFGASDTLSAALVAHPERLDELLTGTARLTSDGIAALHGALAPEADAESHVTALRALKATTTLAIGLGHVAGDLSRREAAGLLTTLAECQVRSALDHARRETRERLGDPATSGGGLVVVAMGKLGAGEMGFGSDLDLVFLYGADGQTATGKTTCAEAFTRTAQRTMRLLSEPSSEGRGYETDTRLRPSGSHGMLVVSLAAFDRYHAEAAAAWERQALVRARVVAGPGELGEQVAKKLDAIAFGGQPPQATALAALRARIELELANETKRRLHPKLGHGALMDVELATQWLQMTHGVRARRTRDAIARLRDGAHLSLADAEAMEDGHEFFRGVEQAMRLRDEGREPVLRGDGERTAVARAIGMRDRDGESAAAALISSWHRHAEEVRGVFERIVAPVGTSPPWNRD